MCVGTKYDKYNVYAFCDSSKIIYGTVIYLYNLRTKEVHFVMSKNRIVNKQLESHSIPMLELQAICLAVECVFELKQELSSINCVIPVQFNDFFVFSDSYVALTWVDSYCSKLNKMNKFSVFIMNRLKKIKDICSKQIINFSFISGKSNPADFLTRPISYGILIKSNFITGPKFINDENKLYNIINFVVPSEYQECSVFASANVIKDEKEKYNLLDFTRYSNYNRLHKTAKLVFTFLNKIKLKLKSKDPIKYAHLIVLKKRVYNFRESWRIYY